MKIFFQKIVLWTYIKIHTILINIGIILYRGEEQMLNMSEGTDEKHKIVQRKLYANPILNKFYAGQRDEIYTQKYYELLKKSDKFIRTATPHKMAIAADKHGSNYGQKDRWGRRYEHYGFFDSKHKHVGKTLGEVLALEMEERRTKDDNYEILYIINNIPIEVGFTKVLNVVEKTEKENVDFEYEVNDMFQKSKQYEFPIKVLRDEAVVNKIEQLTEFLHIKKIGFEHRQLEFFIPLKFDTENINENSKIFKEITNINSIFVKNEYGELMGFSIEKFIKRITYNDTHEVWKFYGIEMQNM